MEQFYYNIFFIRQGLLLKLSLVFSHFVSFISSK